MTAVLQGEGVAAVLFDYGGTLVTFERPVAALEAAYERIRVRLRERGWSPPAAAVLLREVHDRVEDAFAAHQRSGSLEEIDLVPEARRAYADLGLCLDVPILDDLLRLEQEAWWQGVTVDPEAIPTLDALRDRGLRVGLCSNAPYRVRSMHDQLAHVGLDRHLDSVTFSGEVGWRKPSPRMMEAAVTALGASFATAIIVGDSIRDDVGGALAVGMRAVLLRRDPETPDPPARGPQVPVIHRLSAIARLLFGTVGI